MYPGMNYSEAQTVGSPHQDIASPLDRAGVLTGVLLAGALTLPFLGNRSLSLDEVISVIIARDDWTNMWRFMLRHERNMWLYHILLHLWLKLGESEFLVRCLSAIFALGTIPVVFSIGRRLFGSHVGAVAALLLPVNAFFIRYAQVARGYSLLVLLTSLSSYYFVRAIERPSWRQWIAHAVCSALAVYAHFFGALVIVAHLLSVAFLRRRDIPWRGLAITTMTTGLLLLPLILAPDTREDMDWIRQPEARDVGRFFITLAGGLRNVLIFAVLGAAALGFALSRSPRVGPLGGWEYGFLLTWLLAPMAITLSYSLLVKPFFVERYLIICLPPFVLLASVCLSQIGYRWLFATALGAILIMSGLRLTASAVRQEREDWRGVTNFVLSEAQPNDAVLFFAYFVRQPFEYYLGNLAKPADFPRLLELASGPYHPGGGGRLPEPDAELLKGLPNEHTRVWLVLSYIGEPHIGRDVQRDLILSSLGREYTISRKREFPGIQVLLYAGEPNM